MEVDEAREVAAVGTAERGRATVALVAAGGSVAGGGAACTRMRSGKSRTAGNRTSCSGRLHASPCTTSCIPSSEQCPLGAWSASSRVGRDSQPSPQRYRLATQDAGVASAAESELQEGRTPSSRKIMAWLLQLALPWRQVGRSRSSCSRSLDSAPQYAYWCTTERIASSSADWMGTAWAR